MTAYKRWQDWTTVIAGLVLIAAPYVFGETADPNVLWVTGIIGAVMVIAALLAASTRYANAAELLPAMVGVAAFLAPWMANYSNLGGTAWTSWVVGVVAVLAALEVSAQPHAVSHV